MRIIAIANQKGGVGKTTSVINIGAGLADMGNRILLIDLDPQAHLTYSMGFQASKIENTTYGLLKGDVGLNECILQKSGLDIIPSNINLIGTETEFTNLPGNKHLLKQVIKKTTVYNYILIDCPPSLGLLTLNAFTACKEVYITLQCNFLSLQGMANLIDTINLVREKLNNSLKLTGIIATLYDKRRKLSKEVIENIKKHFRSTLFKTRIRYNVSLAEAPGYGLNIFKYAPQSHGAEDYLNLCKEIIQRESEK